jgi:hypothetical protein
MSQLQAQLGAVSRSSRRETRQGQRYIRRLAHSFADELQGIASGIGGTYRQEQQQAAASNAAIANYLQGTGQEMGQDLSAQLAFSPEAAARAGGQQAAVGRAAGKTAAGYGGGNLQQFISDRASNVTFGKELPGIAALSGIQSAGAFQQQQAADLKAQRDAILAQAPGLTADLYSAFANQRLQQQQMAQAERFHAQEMRASDRTAQGENKGRLDQAHADAYNIITGMTTGPSGPLPPAQRPDYDTMRERVASVYRQRFPGRSDSWVQQQVDYALGQFGVNPIYGLGDVLENVAGSVNQAIANFAGGGSVGSRGRPYG